MASDERGRELQAALDLARSAPDDPSASLNAGRLLGRAGHFEEAVDHLARAVAALPERGDAWFYLAMAKYETGDRETARRAVAEAARLAPSNARILAEVAHLQYQLKARVTVLPLAEKLVARMPKSAEAWFALGVAANRAGDWWRGKESLERAVGLGCEMPRCRGELGAALGRLGFHAEAVEALEAALRFEEEPSARCLMHMHLAFAHHNRHAHAECLRHYQAAVAADPGSAHAHHGVGAAYVDLKQLETAVPHLEEAVRLAPNDADSWYAMGRVLAWTADLARAEGALRQAMMLGHAGGRAGAQLAWVCQRQGRLREAADYARRALRRKLPQKWRGWVAAIADGRPPPQRRG
jgi:tetratricopeptide (TPR) repeat protein